MNKTPSPLPVLPFPEDILASLHGRGITDDIISALGLFWTEHGPHKWIAIPILDREGNLLFHKLKRPPHAPERQPKSMVYPKGNGAELFPLLYLHNRLQRVVLCEGEPDALALLSHGIEAVCSTAGAQTFKEEWLEHFPQGIAVVLCFDLDDAGRKGKEKAAKLIQKHRPDIVLSVVDLPENLGKGGDVTDFLLLCQSQEINFETAFFALEKPYGERIEPNPTEFKLQKVQAPESPMNFTEWRRIVTEQFPELALAAEAILSTVCQLLIRDISNCFALVLIDVPSAGKTITINFFDEVEGITYSSDTFTPASFVSNAAMVKREELSKIDLLPRIRRKAFLVRDMATIFSARDDDLLKNMGVLTRVLDGEGLSTDSGSHGRRALRGDYLFMFVAGSTPIPWRVWKTMGTLGARMFFLGLHTRDKSHTELAEQLRKPAYKRKEALCRTATARLMQTLWATYPEGIEWKTSDDPMELLEVIGRCAQLLSRLRGQVQVYREKWDGDDKQEMGHTIPVVEKPDRVNQCLYNLARGHALAMGRMKINEEDIRLVLTLTYDSAPGHRAHLFRELVRRGGTLKTGEIEEFLHCSNPTALKEMATMRVLGVVDEIGGDAVNCDPSKKIVLKADLRWFLGDECRRFLDPTVSESA
ncbi:MAG: toprim domain-containing protein [Candidatus Peribacter sp.]|nr:toprim domain-containing protein [Candidatus Peribacter sp.]